MNRFQLYIAFFRSTWLLSIITGVSITVSGWALSGVFTSETLRSGLFLIPTAGLGIDYLYKELASKEEYFFFYNQGIGKLRLWTVTFLLSAGVCFILNQIIRLCVYVLK